MRIIHICQRDHPDSGGSLRVAEALVREQRFAGLEAWVLFLYGPPGAMAAEFEPHVHCLGLESSRQVLTGFVALRKAIQQIAPDVIHSHDGIRWPRLVLLLLSVPVVMHAHLPVERSSHRIAQMLINRTTHRLIGISQQTIKTWVEAGYPPAQVQYIPNGVDPERFCIADRKGKDLLRRRLGLPVEKRLLLWVGRLHRSTKGTDRVEHVAGLLPVDAVLVVVGNGPEHGGMTERCRDLIDAGKMIMTGSISVPEEYYAAADLFLFTSYYEAFGLVILEAVASGLPIMAFPVDDDGGAMDLLREFEAIQIRQGASEGEIKKAIETSLASTGNGLRLRERVESKYSWHAASEQVEAVYRSVCGTHEPTGNGLRILVCQHGARHRYAIPRMLERAGMLSALYTDSSAESRLGRFVRRFKGCAPLFWQHFARREVRGAPGEKVYSSDISYYIELRQKLFMSQKKGTDLYRQRHALLSSRMQKWGLQGANIVYSMYHESLEFIGWAKKQGARSVVDVYISPITNQLMEEEYESFPDWGRDVDEDSKRIRQELWQETSELADLLICPSEWVADGVRAVSPAAAAKIRVVPYGCSIDYQGRVNEPIKGRILFAGRDPLRKGLHYLAQAASRLKKDIPELDVRIAGKLSPEVVKHPICTDLNFLGQLSGGQMKEEFLSATALVLPALSEGFAGVVAEAIGAGCPVIVTREAGSPIVHEREGLIVPSGDVDALVAAILKMVENREFRDRCSEECLKQIPFYSESAWEERLVHILREIS